MSATRPRSPRRRGSGRGLHARSGPRGLNGMTARWRAVRRPGFRLDHRGSPGRRRERRAPAAARAEVALTEVFDFGIEQRGQLVAHAAETTISPGPASVSDVRPGSRRGQDVAPMGDQVAHLQADAHSHLSSTSITASFAAPAPLLKCKHRIDCRGHMCRNSTIRPSQRLLTRRPPSAGKDLQRPRHRQRHASGRTAPSSSSCIIRTDRPHRRP